MSRRSIKPNKEYKKRTAVHVFGLLSQLILIVFRS